MGDALGSGGESVYGQGEEGKKQAKVSGTHCGGGTVEFCTRCTWQEFMAGWKNRYQVPTRELTLLSSHLLAAPEKLETPHLRFTQP